jgi:hypothetical protein
MNNDPSPFDYFMVGILGILVIVMAVAVVFMLYMVPILIAILLVIPVFSFGAGYILLQIPFIRNMFWF